MIFKISVYSKDRVLYINSEEIVMIDITGIYPNDDLENDIDSLETPKVTIILKNGMEIIAYSDINSVTKFAIFLSTKSRNISLYSDNIKIGGIK